MASYLAPRPRIGRWARRHGAAHPADDGRYRDIDDDRRTCPGHDRLAPSPRDAKRSAAGVVTIATRYGRSCGIGE
ncbi:hypothetical protein, partial [Escherichia coli]|uniref:hypothetical protein n=1 Tax=Escherichia coli TaxID=562 RepID=UPI001BFE0098